MAIFDKNRSSEIEHLQKVQNFNIRIVLIMNKKEGLTYFDDTVPRLRKAHS